MEDDPSRRTIRLATPEDLTYLDKLQKKFGNSVGFFCRQALLWNLERGNAAIASENDEPAGYLLTRPALQWQPALASIFQACVQMDAQRRHHGVALLKAFEEKCRIRGSIAIQANCAIGVEANEFWRLAGFLPICHMTPHNVRGREVICWRKPLSTRLPAWFAFPPQRAGYGARRPVSKRDPNRRIDHVALALRYLSASPRGTDKEEIRGPAQENRAA